MELRGKRKKWSAAQFVRKLYKESSSCTHVSKASCFCLYSSRCCLVEEGKLAAKTDISQVVKMWIHLSIWSVLTPPHSSASFVWHSTRSRSLLTAGRTGARHPPEAWPKSLIFVGCRIASICCASQTPVGWMSPLEGEVHCQRNGTGDPTTLLYLCDTASVPPSHPKPLLVGALVGLV